MSDIESWNAKKIRKPLILMGARQVGKTWLMEEFAKRTYPGDAEVDFLLQGADAVYPVEAKAERNLKAKGLRTYREFFAPPRCYRTSLERHRIGKLTEDVPLYAVDKIVEETGSRSAR